MNEKNPLKLSVLIPVRNEGINLKVMLKILKAVVEVPHEVLVVHDTPEDDCKPVVEAMKNDYPNLRAVHNTLGKGVANAISFGVDHAQGDFVLIFAADEVGPVLAVKDLLNLADQGCEFISCTRYAHGGRRLGGSLIGKTLSYMANFLFHHLSGAALTDSTTGIKMFRRNIFPQLQLKANSVGWTVAFEMAIKAQLLGFRLGEVPIISIDRLYGGESTFHLRSWVFEYLKWYFWGTKELRKQKTKVTKKDVLIRIPQGGGI